jgi:hypothetical protein
MILKNNPIFIIAFLFFSLSCDNKDNTDELQDYEVGDGLIPAAIGNMWIYADSMWIEDTLYQAFIDTIVIGDTIHALGYPWWFTKGMNENSFRSIPGMHSSFFYNENDTIISLQYAWSFYPSIKFLLPIDSNTSFYTSIEDWHSHIRTVSYLDEPYIHSIASFEDCLIFTGDEWNEETILKPGVGVLYHYVERDDSWSGNRKLSKTLIEYDLVIE